MRMTWRSWRGARRQRKGVGVYKWFQLRLPLMNRAEVDGAESVLYWVRVGWRMVHMSCWLCTLLVGRRRMCRGHCLVVEERFKVSDMRKALYVGKVSGWWTRRRTCCRSWTSCYWSRGRGAWRPRWPTGWCRGCVGEMQGEGEAR